MAETPLNWGAWLRKIDQQAKGLAANPEGPSLILGSHMVEGEKWLPKVVLTS